MLQLSGDLRSLLRTGLSRSLSSLLIKVATAGLTYLAYVVLARMMDVAEYGYFAFGLALATILAIGAGMGQQTAILRFWAEENAKNQPEKAVAALEAGGGLTILASLITGLGLAAAAMILAAIAGPGEPVWHYYATAILVLPMALAEYNSSALRAQGSIWTALGPRDIVWRIVLPGAALLMGAFGLGLSGWGAILLSAGLLYASLILQYALARQRGYRLLPGFGAIAAYWRERGTVSLWFLFGGFINALALNIDTIIVGAMLDPQSAGAYFNAFRTAGLMTLFAFAIALVIAPMIAQYFHARDYRKAQAILAIGTWAGFGFSLVCFIGFLLFGQTIMSLFGEDYAGATPLLIVLGLGFLVDAATGPSRTVLMMTGHERSYALLFTLAVLLSILAQIAVLPFFGLMGVAVVNSAARLLAYGLLSIHCMRKVGLDPTIFGILKINRATHSAGGAVAAAPAKE